MKLEVINDKGEVVRSYHTSYDETEGNRMRLTVNDNVYHLGTDGDFTMLTEEQFDDEPKLKGIDKQWATEFKERINSKEPPVYLNPETGQISALFNPDTMIPIADENNVVTGTTKG